MIATALHPLRIGGWVTGAVLLLAGLQALAVGYQGGESALATGFYATPAGLVLLALASLWPRRAASADR